MIPPWLNTNLPSFLFSSVFSIGVTLLKVDPFELGDFVFKSLKSY